MALKNKSLFLYGFTVSETNRSIDFLITSGGTELRATLTLGFYSLSGLCAEVVRAMKAADPTHIYTCTADRTFSGGTQNRVTIQTNGTFLSLLFGSGSRFASTCAPLLGFTSTDKVGATSYQGTSSAGTVLIPEYVGYNYIPPQIFQKVFGAVNVSSSGVKEAVVFNIQKFWKVEFKHEAEAAVITQWSDLFQWMIQQHELEFTPEISSPSIFYIGTLESTGSDGKGLGFMMTEQLPEFPFRYQTGVLTFRQKN